MAIIGISGKKGAGKDTIGKIIQHLTRNYTDDLDIIAYNVEQDKDITSDWQIKKFATKLKEIVSILTGCSVEDLESQEFKNELLSREWDFVDTSAHGNVTLNTVKRINLGMNNKYTYRRFLQRVGTDAMRNLVHEDIWVNALFVDYKEELDAKHFKSNIGESTLKFPNWIITDVRFINELEAIKNRGGLMIRVNRSINDTDSHISEQALDYFPSDIVIDNNGTIRELVEKVKQIITK